MKRLAVLVSVSLTVGACAGGGSAALDATAPTPGLTLALRPADLPGGGAPDPATRGVTSIMVRIDGIAFQRPGDGWQGIAFDAVDVDLLRLSESSEALHLDEIGEGRVNQIRLFVTDGDFAHVVLEDGRQESLKVPSGLQSGIKLKGPFDLRGCNARLTLDVDGRRSIHVHERGRGRDGEWILRPVIRVGGFDGGEACDDPGLPGDDPGQSDQPGTDDPGQPGGNDGDGSDGGDEPVCIDGEACEGGAPGGDGTPTDGDGDGGSDGGATDPGGDVGDVDGGDTAPEEGGDGLCFDPEGNDYYPCAI